MKKSKNNKKHLFGVILAGGSGTRLWPISRELYPKQLLKLTGNKTMIQQTYIRLKKFIPLENIYIVTAESFTNDIYFQLKGLGLNRKNIIREPFQKNTAAAIALASKIIFERNKEAILLISPSDHIIGSDSDFIKAAKKSFEIAKDGFLLTFGIIPAHPSSEFGYIGADRKKTYKGAFKVKKFVEKPTPKRAKKLIQEKYFLNSGIFIWKAEAILAEIKKFLPKIYRAAELYSRNFNEFLKIFRSLESISIDKGVLEKSKKILVLPAKFQWQDIGSWKSLHQLLPKDTNLNILNEYVISENCSECFIQGTKKRIVVGIGLKNLIVVDTEDAVLVSHKNHTHQVKNLVEKIRKNNLAQYLQHPTVYRPWGYFTVLKEGKNFKVKKVLVEPKQKLSLQLHRKRAEHWTVLSGKAKVIIENKTFNLGPHQSIDIPIKTKHRLENPSSKSLEIIEIQSGNYLKEDDIIRFEDKYGRK